MSHVLRTGVASPVEASAFFEAQLKFRTDPADLAADLLAGEADEGGSIVVIDTRSPAHYAEGHIPGAISFPHRTMSPATTQGLSPGTARSRAPRRQPVAGFQCRQRGHVDLSHQRPLRG